MQEWKTSGILGFERAQNEPQKWYKWAKCLEKLCFAKSDRTSSFFCSSVFGLRVFLKVEKPGLKQRIRKKRNPLKSSPSPHQAETQSSKNRLSQA